MGNSAVLGSKTVGMQSRSIGARCLRARRCMIGSGFCWVSWMVMESRKISGMYTYCTTFNIPSQACLYVCNSTWRPCNICFLSPANFSNLPHSALASLLCSDAFTLLFLMHELWFISGASKVTAGSEYCGRSTLLTYKSLQNHLWC